MKKYRLTIARFTFDDSAFALLDFESPLDLNEDEIRQAITCAVTEWMKTTKAGKESWVFSNRNFNVGDLDQVVDHYTLTSLLKKNNIYNLKIEIIRLKDAARNWSYDTVLINEEEIEE